MKIKQKLISGYSVIALICAVTVGYGILSLSFVQEEISRTAKGVSANIAAQERLSALTVNLTEIISAVELSSDLSEVSSAKELLLKVKGEVSGDLSEKLDGFVGAKREFLAAVINLNQSQKKSVSLLNDISTRIDSFITETEESTSKTLGDATAVIKKSISSSSDVLNEKIDTMTSFSDKVTSEVKAAFTIRSRLNRIVGVVNRMFAESDKDLVRSLNLQIVTLCGNVIEELPSLNNSEMTDVVSEKVKQLKTLTEKLVNEKSVVVTKENEKAVSKTLAELQKEGQTLADNVIKMVMEVADNTEFEGVIAVEDSVTELKDNAAKNAKVLMGEIGVISNAADQGVSGVKTVMMISVNCSKFDSLIRQTLSSESDDSVVGLMSEIESTFSSTKSLIDTISDKSLAQKFMSSFTSFKGIVDGMVVEKKSTLLYAAQIASIEKELETFMEGVRKNSFDESKKLKESTHLSQQKSEQAVDSRRVILITFGLFAIVFAFCIGFIIAALITKPINEMTSAVEEIAAGNINVELDYRGTDEIGTMSDAFRNMVVEQQKKVDVAVSIADGDFTNDVNVASEKDILGYALRNMSEKLDEVLYDINESAVKVSAVSNQVSGSSQELSDGAINSASSLEEVTSTMAEIGAQTKANASNATAASQLASDAKQAAEQGNVEMNRMQEAMVEISASSEKIAQIIKVIDDIAFQTNLLALNAAVEAARAGTHGKGFAVVADEVRSLAGRSAKAARETADLIEESVKRVGHGTEIAEKTGVSLVGIVDKVGKVSDLIREIAESSSEQANGVEQVSTGLGQIDAVTQQNSASAEETASASSELSIQAQELQQRVSQFKLRDTSLITHAGNIKALN